jgi:histidine triad (HIT) family protein
MAAADCIFCRIVTGEARASIAYEDETGLAFLDPRQANAGHTLVIPKAHIETIFDLDPPTGSALMTAIAEVSRGIRTAFPGEGMSIWQSNGPGASQEVPHVHFHLMPRIKGDGMLRIYPGHLETASREDLDECAARLRAALDTALTAKREFPSGLATSS